MSEYFAVVFSKKQYFQYRLRDLIENSFNGVVNEEYTFQGIRYYFPVVVENGQYFLDSRNPVWTFNINGMIISEKYQLRSGDLINISCEDTKLAILVIGYDLCSISSTIYRLNRDSVIFMGRGSDMDIVINTSHSVSRKHVSIRVGSKGDAYLDDLSGNTGVFVNGIRVTNYRLNEGDHIYIMGACIVYYKDTLIVPSNLSVKHLNVCNQLDTVTPDDAFPKDVYIRTPRIQKSLDRNPIAIDNPTPIQRQKEVPFILTAGPSITMTLAMIASLGVTISRVMNTENSDYTSLIPSAVMALSMLLGAVLWPKLSRNYYRKMAEENEIYRQTKYHHYLESKEAEITQSYERNTRIWNESLYPNSKALIDIVATQNRHLWERTNRDRDFLEIRLGNGQKSFEVDVSIKRRGFELEEDFLQDEAYGLAEKYKNLNDVPITVSLNKHKVIGVVGEYLLIAHNIITNLVSLYAPDEVKIVLVYNQYQEKLLGIFNDMHHMWSSDRSSRFVATTEAEAYTLFGALDEKLEQREGILSKDEIRTPHYIVMVFDSRIVENIPFKKTLIDPDNKLGVSSIFFGERFNQIPKESKVIVQRNTETCGIYIKNENDNRFINFEPDELDKDDIENLVRAIAQVQVKQERNEINVPERISFLDVYRSGNVDSLNIRSHWNANNSNKSLAAPIGVKAGGEIFNLDIHEKYHGCHGLVAGTTGSGKSEFLQAYIASMMINYSPNEVAFVLVDFKGGDMARPFLNTPHLAATISNLSGNILYRALISLEAEVKNRQRLFNEAASKLSVDKIDINSYQRYYKENRITQALPHLIIVIDEFAQLKTQHPEFMSKLIDIAQVGRSLGIHLILATQKPSGVVDPQIWSNSRFKVCLKVMDRQDSMDMINKPVAALIKTPGRAYVQVGYDEVFELIQSGYSGAKYIPKDSFVDEGSITVSMVNWAAEGIREAKALSRGEKSDLTQLEAVMKSIANLGIELNVHAKRLWLDPLPERLLLTSAENDAKTAFSTVTCGLMDIPHLQKQITYTIDFVQSGHLAIYGASGTGKSTFVQTILYQMAVKNSPDRVNSYVIDCNGGSLIGLSHMPHCAAYVTDADENRVNQVLDELGQIINERRARFVEANCANYRSYISSGRKDMPMLLAVIDNYSSFREKLFKCEDVLVQIIAAATACGMYFIITGNSKGAIYYKVTDHIRNKVVLNMNDSGSYRDILNTRIPVIPDNIKGRGLTVYEKNAVEIQIGVPFDASSEPERVSKIKQFYDEQMKKYGKLKREIPTNAIKSENVIAVGESIYHKQELKEYHSIHDNSSICIGRNLAADEVIEFSLKNQKKAFIANRNDRIETINDICKEIERLNYKPKVYSNRYEQIGVLNEYRIDDIDSYVLSHKSSTDVMLIDGFTDFFDEISDEALTHFERELRGELNYAIMTIDDLKRISDYSSTELFLQLVKCEFGVVLEGMADNICASLLSNEFYSIPEEYRNISLKDTQAIVYYKDCASYAELGGLK